MTSPAARALPPALAARAANVAWLLLDVDGVLTDGRLYFGPRETAKAFHVRDGLGIRRALDQGILIGLLTGRSDPATDRRAAELGIEEVISGASDKGAALDAFLGRHDVDPASIAYAGDDLPDLPVLERVGLSFAPSDADPEVCRRVDHVLATAGGRGAVRELIDLLLAARNATGAGSEAAD